MLNTYRYPENPLITPADVKPFNEGFEVIGSFNAGVAEYDGEVLLLLRVAERPISPSVEIVKVPVYNAETKIVEIVELDRNNPDLDFSDPRVVREKNNLDGFIYLTSLSYIRLARSTDGHNFTIDDTPFVFPYDKYTSFGIEDPRCTQIGEDYVITYSAVSELGICEAAAVTQDFKKVKFLGNIFAPENKDVVIFPERIKGSYYAFHRPSLKSIGNLDIWIASSPDLVSWGNHQHLIGARDDAWDAGRVGAGIVPIKTAKGWLELYHGATKDNRYCMGALLLDLDDPTKIIARSKTPILEPEVDYEKNGFFGEVVFACGALVEEDLLKMYYGVSDTSMAGCEMKISDILNQLEEEM